MLSEARPVGLFFRPNVFRESPFPEEGWDDARRMLLDAVSTAYAHHGDDRDPKLIIKCHAINLLHIRLIRSAWPAVPCIIVIRDPLEVMISNFAKPGRWMKWREDPITARRVFGWSEDDVRKMPVEEYCARGLGSFIESAKKAVD